jgi:putative hemolysin
LHLLAAAALLVFNLYISTLAYVLRAYSRARLSDHLTTDSGRRWLDWLDRYESELQVTTSFVRLVTNLALLLVMCDWFWTEPVIELRWGVVLPPLLTTLALNLLVGIGIAHGLAAHDGERVLARSFGPLWLVRWVFWPVALSLGGIDFVVRRLLGKPEETEEEETERLEEEILDAVSEGKALGAVDEEQEEMIEAVFALHDTAVSAIMTPRTDIVALRTEMTLDDVREVIAKAGHSRIPVIEDSLDQIIGMLYVKDLALQRSEEAFDVRRMLRPVQYIPETKTIGDLLREFRQKKVHIAVVLDEYGGTAGLVTIEDILEELVGEIDDEYDQSTPPPINRIDDDTLEVDARVHVSEINEELEVELPEDEDFETIGGFVFSKLGKIPAAGEEFAHENLRFRVISAEARKINRLRIRVVREAKEKQPA